MNNDEEILGDVISFDDVIDVFTDDDLENLESFDDINNYQLFDDNIEQLEEFLSREDDEEW
ncbi:MAG: hypothetical protein PUA90_02495 [bacterium]|nr:hypothetical protein [bacterium]